MRIEYLFTTTPLPHNSKVSVMHRLRFFTIICFVFVAWANHAWADGGGGCFADSYVAYENSSKDVNGIYVVFFGGPVTITNPVRIQLPRNHGPYLQGIKCERDKVLVALRGPERKGQKGSEFDIFVSEISVISPIAKFVRESKPYIQVWEGYTRKARSTSPKGEEVIEIPPPTIDVEQILRQDGRKQKDLGAALFPDAFS